MGRPAFLGDSVQCPMLRRPCSCPRHLGPIPEASRCRPDVPGNSRLGPKARGVDQLSRLNLVQFQGPVGRQAVPVDSSPGPNARRFEQQSRVTRAHVRGPAA